MVIEEQGVPRSSASTPTLPNWMLPRTAKN